MTYAELFRAMCALNLDFSWNIQVDTWLHPATYPDQPRCPVTEWVVYLSMPLGKDGMRITGATAEIVFEHVKTFLETGTIGGKELDAIGDCKVETLNVIEAP